MMSAMSPFGLIEFPSRPSFPSSEFSVDTTVPLAKYQTPFVQPLPGSAAVVWTDPLARRIEAQRTRLPLGESGRVKVKQLISSTIRDRPELRPIINGIGKLKSATIAAMIEMCIITGTLEQAKLISQEYLAEKSNRKRCENSRRRCSDMTEDSPSFFNPLAMGGGIDYLQEVGISKKRRTPTSRYGEISPLGMLVPSSAGSWAFEPAALDDLFAAPGGLANAAFLP